MLIALIALAFVVGGLVIGFTGRASWIIAAVVIAVGVLIFVVFNGRADDDDLGLMAAAVPIRFTRWRTRPPCDTVVSHSLRGQS